MKINDIIEIEIKDLADNGKGIAFIEINKIKYSIFIPLTVPEDVVKVKIKSIKKLYIEADLIEIIKQSKHRIKPICEHFFECGACDLLHLNYDEQVKAKEKILLRYLERAKLNFDEIEIIKSDKELFYRDRSKFFKIDETYGFKKRSSNKVIPIKKCYIINEKLNEIFSKKTLKKRDDEIYYGFCYERNQISSAKCAYFVNNKKIYYKPDLFVQSNLTMNQKLIEIVCNESKGKKILDLYSGNGNFSIPLSQKVENVTSIEGDEKSFKLLLKNIKDINNIEAINANVNEININQYFDTIVLDPPRIGTDNLLNKIKDLTKKIVYVSCNAKKAIKELKELKNYSISKIYLIDMFPQTIHFETVFVLNLIE
jgi:23S rRNA (uracil1939-C5)-methyltransferase